MNIDYIKKKVECYLDEDNLISENDVFEIFKNFSKEEKIEMAKILNNLGISIGESKKSKKNKKRSICSDELLNLTNEELCILYQRGKKETLDALVEKNEKLIYSRVVKIGKYYKHKLEEDDLFQYGVIGFMKSVERFKDEKETKLTTYTVNWIDQSIMRAITDYGFTIRIPVHVFENINKLNRLMRTFPYLSTSELKEKSCEIGINKDKFNMLLTILNNILDVSSLNVFIGSDEETELGDFISNYNDDYNVEEEVINKVLRDKINLVLETLNERERDIILYRMGFITGSPMTLEQIGKKYNVTRERIRQIEAKALRRLRHPSRGKLLKDFYEEW